MWGLVGESVTQNNTVENIESLVKTALKALGRKSQVIPGGKNKILTVLLKRVMSRDMNTKM